jgi:predicted nuclease with TOPRIM domain
MKRLAALVVVLASLTGCAGSRDVQADRVQHLEIEVNGLREKVRALEDQVEDLYDRLSRSKVNLDGGGR